MTSLQGVRVPEEMQPIFESAAKHVSEFFASFHRDPVHGVLTVGGERYILVRATSMSVHFLEHIRNLYPGLDRDEALHAAAEILFDVSHALGQADAKALHRRMGMQEPLERLSAGPMHFAHAGWATVEILAEGAPTSDEDYYLVYNHLDSFEADSWLRVRGKVDHTVCFMNAGYSSGWCMESYGLPLSAREILCRARGDDFCRFIMAPPERLHERVATYRAAHPEIFPNTPV